MNTQRNWFTTLILILAMFLPKQKVKDIVGDGRWEKRNYGFDPCRCFLNVWCTGGHPLLRDGGNMGHCNQFRWSTTGPSPWPGETGGCCKVTTDYIVVQDFLWLCDWLVKLKGSMAVDQGQVKGGGHWLVTLGQVKGDRHWLKNTANSINVAILIRNIIITLSYFLIFNGTQELITLVSVF